jgi:hypothetical protein
MITGIQKPTNTSTGNYQIHLLQSLVTNKTRIPRESTFKITFGIANYGGNTFDGEIALGLYKGDSLVSILKKYTDMYIQSYYGDSGMVADSLSIPLPVADGDYQLYSIYKAKDQGSWSVMRYKVGNPNSLNVTVTNTAVTLTTPEVYPQLALNEPLKVIGNIYKGETARISATIQNTGSEYNSYLFVMLKGDSTYQYVNIDIINIPGGTTKTIELTGDITQEPGDYKMSILYDFNNNQDSPSMELLSPATNSSISVTVKDTLTIAPALTLTEKMSLVDSTITNGSEAVLTAKVKNAGGFFNNNLIAFIFTSTGKSSIDYIGPKKVILDANEEKEITLNKDINLEEGTYYLALYFYNDSISGGWDSLTPDLYSKIKFTVTNPTGIEEATTGKLSIYPNPATDVIYVQSPYLIKSITILDISGKQILRQELPTTGTVTVNNLSKGVYLIKIETDEGTYTEKLFKK